MLLERDGFPIEETPTNVRHVALLRNMTTLVKGITLNTNLYTNKARVEDEECELLPKQAESEFESSCDPNVKSASASDYSAAKSRKNPRR